MLPRTRVAGAGQALQSMASGGMACTKHGSHHGGLLVKRGSATGVLQQPSANPCLPAGRSSPAFRHAFTQSPNTIPPSMEALHAAGHGARCTGALLLLTAGHDAGGIANMQRSTFVTCRLAFSGRGFTITLPSSRRSCRKAAGWAEAVGGWAGAQLGRRAAMQAGGHAGSMRCGGHAA